MLRQGRALHPLQKLQLWPIRLVAGAWPGPLLVLSYRRALIGRRFTTMVGVLLRDRSSWSPAELELFMAYTARLLRCSYCADSHAVVAELGMGEALVEQAMRDWRSAPVREPVRAMLGFLSKFVPPDQDFGPADIAALRDAGVSDEAIRQALFASWGMQNLARWGQAMGWESHDRRVLVWAGRAIRLFGYWWLSVWPG